MARHRVPRETKPGFGPKVEVVPLAGARLVTVGPESEAWKVFELPADASKLRDSFVRLRPPVGVTDEAVERVHRLFTGAGARVRVEMPNAPIVVSQATEVEEEAAHESAREVVLQLVDEAHTTERDALKGFCESVMAEVGL